MREYFWKSCGFRRILNVPTVRKCVAIIFHCKTYFHELDKLPVEELDAEINSIANWLHSESDPLFASYLHANSYRRFMQIVDANLIARMMDPSEFVLALTTKLKQVYLLFFIFYCFLLLYFLYCSSITVILLQFLHNLF